eukprot:TRINITY_DN5763_c0_g1_i1.p1 TRINITY_DN5763_c0_g1~~TRINITY_DN5763_c0_g1_i1.p1  ORF type:complete len:92 (+),score=10.48 TRINITY_DN5763_c0_g1_i1:171-446(+)
MVKANDEAVNYFTRALQLMAVLERNSRPQTPQRLEHCHSDLAKALYSQGKHKDAIEHYKHALHINGTLSSHSSSKTQTILATESFHDQAVR